jgi:hypothetical protein
VSRESRYLEKNYDWWLLAETATDLGPSLSVPLMELPKPGTETNACADDAGQRVPGISKQRYFFLRAADFLAARKEIPARIAFC